MRTLRQLLWLTVCVAFAAAMIGCSTGGGGGGAVTTDQITDDTSDDGTGDQTGDGTTDDGASDGGEESTENLTGLEEKAVVTACNAPAALAQATDVAEDATGDLADGRSSESQQSLPTEVTFGTCPEVTKSGSLTASLADGLDLAEGEVALTVDFGEQPCTALVVEEEDFTLACSGSATGTFSLTEETIGLVFDSISCNEQALDGTVDLSYDLYYPGVALDGAWDLTWYPGNEAIGTEGNGKGAYEPAVSGCCDVTSIEEFTGNITYEGYEWSTSIQDLLISLEEYCSFIPYGGSITLDGPDIRTITITFTENSPTTGEVAISIDGSQSFTVSLYELEAWAEMMLTE